MKPMFVCDNCLHETDKVVTPPTDPNRPVDCTVCGRPTTASFELVNPISYYTIALEIEDLVTGKIAPFIQELENKGLIIKSKRINYFLKKEASYQIKKNWKGIPIT